MSRMPLPGDAPNGRRSSRDAILESGSEVFALRGLSGARVEDIVQRSGVNVRMLYHHFGSKEGLYAEVVGRLLNVQTLSSERGEFDCSVNWLRHQHARLVRFFWDSPVSLSMLSWELAEQRTGAQEKLGMKAIIPLLIDPINEVKDEGLARTSKTSEDIAALMIHQAAYLLRLSSSGVVSEFNQKSCEEMLDELWAMAAKEILNLSPHPA